MNLDELLCPNCDSEEVTKQGAVDTICIQYKGEATPRIISFGDMKVHHLECSDCGHRWHPETKPKELSISEDINLKD